MACEITVKVKDSLKSMTKKMLIYERVSACFSDDNVDALIADAVKNFGGEPTKTTVTIKLLGD